MKLQPWPINEPIPLTCKVSDVCRILAISPRTFWRLRAERRLPLTELVSLGKQLRFDGHSVERARASKFMRVA